MEQHQAIPRHPQGDLGSDWWDVRWPYPRPSLSRLGQLMAQVADNMAMAAKAMLPSVQQAAEAIREFGRALAATDQSPPPGATDDRHHG